MSNNLFDFYVDENVSEATYIGLPLKYTLPRIKEATKDILYEAAKDSAHFLGGQHNRKLGIEQVGPITREPPEGEEIEPDWIADERRLLLVPTKELTRKLDEIFDYESMGTNPDSWWTDGFEVIWKRNPKNMRYWYPTVGARGLCEPNFFRARVEDKKYNEQCPCPAEFIDICWGIVGILKEHALEDHTAEYNATPKEELKRYL